MPRAPLPRLPASAVARLRVCFLVSAPGPDATGSRSNDVLGPLGMVWRVTLNWRGQSNCDAVCHLEAHAPDDSSNRFTATASCIRLQLWRHDDRRDGWSRTAVRHEREPDVTFAPPTGFRWIMAMQGRVGPGAGRFALAADWLVTSFRAAPPPRPWSPGRAPCAGIENQGATCYLNSLLQVRLAGPSGGVTVVTSAILCGSWFADPVPHTPDPARSV